MAEYERKVREILAKNGCRFQRHGKGDHDIWYSPVTNRFFPWTGKSNPATQQMQSCGKAACRIGFEREK